MASAKKILKAIKDDEFWSLSNPLVPIVLVLTIVFLITKLYVK